MKTTEIGALFDNPFSKLIVLLLLFIFGGKALETKLKKHREKNRYRRGL